MKNLLKSLWTIFLLVILMVVPSQAQDAPPPSRLSLEEARRAAQERMRIQVDGGYASEWIGATLGDPIELFDLSGAVSAYLFPAIRRDEPTGYLTVAAAAIPNPVLEFTTKGDHPFKSGLDRAQNRALMARTKLLNERPLYLGLLTYAYELTPSIQGRRVVNVTTGAIAKVDSRRAAVPLISILPDPAVSRAISPMSYKLIDGVPDWNQFWGSYGCYSGCSPTSGVNVMGYWDDQGYGNLINGDDWQGAVNAMRNYMDTECVGSAGSTNVGDISSGMVNYAQDQGYYFESALWCSHCSTQPTYANYRAEINANNPVLVDVIDHTTYGDHTVAGVGYNTSGNYMIVHDNWSGTRRNCDLQYGTGYSSIWMHPVAPDSTPPSKATNVRPDGWDGPYTSDTTPGFRWGAASDSGSDIAGYYASVSDWTPDGNDWWTENTNYIVPNALSDGEYHFAVTSKDNAGNVNPTDTNQKGDAPYYTFYVDTQAPSSEVNPLPQEQEDVSFSVSWGGSDGGSGIKSYDIESRAEGSDWTTWKSNTASTSDTFQGSRGQTYCFRSRARDQAGNIESWSAGDGDTCTFIRSFSIHLPVLLRGSDGTPGPTPTLAPSDWHIESVDSNADYAAPVSMALDGNNPHMGYHSLSESDLKYAYRDAQGWHIQTVDSEGNAGWSASLVLDGSSYPHISYVGNDDLKYAYKSNAGWHSQTVVNIGEGTPGTSLALDQNAHPHISFCEDNSGLTYAYQDTQDWHIQTVYGGGCGHVSLALDENDDPHVSYYDLTNGDLKYAHQKSDSWHIRTIESDGDVGLRGSLALDRDNHPHISYYDSTNGDLKYAYRDAQGWHVQTVRRSGDVGLESSLVVDENGHPHISYWNLHQNRWDDSDDLEYAYHDAEGWHIQVVESVESGSWDSTSLALSRSGDPHIGYICYDGTDFVLKHAWYENH